MKLDKLFTFRGKKIFYGWYIVMGLATVGMVSVGLGGLNFGLFIHPMHEELGINHSFFGLAQTARLVGFALSSWIIGKILDRYGARFPMAIAACLMGICMVSLSLINSGWQLVLLYLIMGLIGMQGAGGNLFQSVPLSRWFVRKRGRAMSLAFLGTTAGMFVLTPLIQYTITILSWRHAWLIIGGGSCLIILIIALSVIRKDPESIGLRPDGDSSENTETGTDDFKKISFHQSEYSWTRPQAVRTFSFWALITVLGLRMFSMGTINIFRIPFYIEQGVSAQLVAWSISAEAVIAALIAIPVGWAVDRFQSRFLLAISLMIFIITFIVTIYVRTTFQVFIATMLFGISASSFIVIQNAMWPNYFGSRFIGTIRGFAMPMTLFFSAIGAPVTGAIKDATGKFTIAWLFGIACLTVATGLVLIARKPVPPVNQQDAG